MKIELYRKNYIKKRLYGEMILQKKISRKKKLYEQETIQKKTI